MEIIGPLIIATIAGFSTVLGGLVVFFKIKPEKTGKFISFCLSFSLAVMIVISITDLIPESSRIIIENKGILKGILICLAAFTIGAFLINIINQKINKAKEKLQSHDNSLYRVGILSMIALMLHNLPEGIATFMSAYKDIGLGITFAISIIAHNIPEGISIAVPIYYATGKRSVAIKKTFISGLAEPLGAFLAFIFLSRFINDQLISMVLIFVAGIMITLSINELFPQAMKYEENKCVLAGFVCGILVMLLTHFFI